MPIEWNKPLLARVPRMAAEFGPAGVVRCTRVVVVPLALVWSAGVLAAPDDSGAAAATAPEQSMAVAPAARSGDDTPDNAPVAPPSEPVATPSDNGRSQAANQQAGQDEPPAAAASQDVPNENVRPFAAPLPADRRPVIVTDVDAPAYGRGLGNLSSGYRRGDAVLGGFGFNGANRGGCGYGGIASRVTPSPGMSVLDRPDTPQRATRRYIRASVSGSETYSDNINLVSDDRAESDFVTAVAPRLDACSTTGRFQGQASYQLQGVVYANNSEYNDIYNDLDASATIDLVPQHLYLDAETRYGQQVIDPGLGSADSNIIRPRDNQTSAWRSNISPYLVQRLGNIGTGVLRYRYGRVDYGDDDVPDSSVQSVYGSYFSPEQAAPWSWEANAVTQWVDSSSGNPDRFANSVDDVFGDGDFPGPRDDRDRDRTRRFDSAMAQIGYQLTPRLQLNALGGVEDDYQPDGSNDRWSAPRWQIGARYDTAASSFAVDYGHRFYGSSYALSASHHTALFNFRLAYQEDPSTGGLDSLGNIGSGSTFGSMGSIDNLLGGGEFGDSFNDNSPYNRNVYINKRWNADIDFDTALTETHIGGFVQHREATADDADDSRYHGIDIDTRYAVRPRTSIVPSARWIHYEGGPVDFGDSDRYEAGVSVVRAISRTAQAAVGYGRTWREGQLDYDENRITLQFRKSF